MAAREIGQDASSHRPVVLRRGPTVGWQASADVPHAVCRSGQTAQSRGGSYEVRQYLPRRADDGSGIALTACTAYTSCMQYTLRNVPPLLDGVLRHTARQRGASLNDVVLEALTKGAGLTAERIRHRTLGDLAGAWQHDPQFDDAIREQDIIDPTLWR